MGLKNIFARKPRETRLEKMTPAAKYHELDRAVGRGDLARVKELLAAGADPSYRDPYHYGTRPLVRALERNMLEIFKALLESPGSARALRREYVPEGTVHLKKDAPDGAFFTPTYLYRAIETGKEDFALALARHPAVDIEYAGTMLGYKLSHPHWTKYIPLVKPVIDLAREKGMKQLVQVLSERMQNERDQKLREAAEKRRAEADELRAQAAVLLERAETLDPSSPPKPRPQPKPGKLNI